MNPVVRVLTKSKIAKRFLLRRVKNGRAFKFGRMLIRARMAGKLIDGFTKNNGNSMKAHKKYKEMENKYNQLHKRIIDLEQKFSRVTDDDSAQELAFTLGRQVIELRRLYEQMQSELKRSQQNQIAIAAVQKTR